MLKIPAIQREKAKKSEKKTDGLLPMLVCLLLALALFLFLLSVEQKQLAAYEKGTVLTAAQFIPRDTEITGENIKKYFMETEMPLENIPSAACLLEEELIGKYCAADVDMGNVITESMFSEITETLPADHVLVSINTSDLDQNVAGTLRAGDIIDVYVLKEKENGGYTAMQICNAASVQRSYNSSGTAIMREDTDTVAQVVTIPMRNTDAAYFLEALETGSVKLVKYVNP